MDAVNRNARWDKMEWINVFGLVFVRVAFIPILVGTGALVPLKNLPIGKRQDIVE